MLGPVEVHSSELKRERLAWSQTVADEVQTRNIVAGSAGRLCPASCILLSRCQHEKAPVEAYRTKSKQITRR